MDKVITIDNPIRISIPKQYLSKIELSQLKAKLSYINKSAQYQLSRLKQYNSYYPDEVYLAKVKELEKEIHQTLLFEEEDCYWTYTGLLESLKTVLDWPINDKRSFPVPRPTPFLIKPNTALRAYQEESIEKLLECKHGAVSLPTGAGKGYIILNLIKKLGLKTIIMTPSTSISEQIYQDFVYHLGKKFVGKFYGNTKEYKKLITIGNAQSLTRLQPGSIPFLELSKAKVLCCDENHTCPAETLQSVCFGLAANAPYRFFFSATQMRNDGSDLLLKAITGPVVQEMTTRECVDKGYLSKPIFTMFNVNPDSKHQSKDANNMTRTHLYYNSNVIKKIAQLVNSAVDNNMPTLVLIEELNQFNRLLPYLKHKPMFAHGPLTKENKDVLQPEYTKSDPNDLVKQFDEGKFKLLIGTSCISMGTNIKSVKFLVYWQGGSSEIQVKQAIGRGTRLFPGKTNCHIVDFKVHDIITNKWGDDVPGPVSKHADIRKEIYNDLYGPVRVV